VRVYHFLNKKFGLLAVQKRRLKISRFNSLNDPFEMAAPAGATQDERNAYGKALATFDNDHGLLCFSKSWHNPLLWSHYADRHKGICLGFDISDQIGRKVKYTSKRVQCDWNRFGKDKQYGSSIMLEVYSTKYTHWKYENEVRYMMDLDNDCEQKSMYFMDYTNEIVLKEVILGANCSASRDQLSKALGRLVSSVKCRKARLAFESFKIVEQKDAKLWN
jgi:Protein of unknown function (DUF2971)